MLRLNVNTEDIKEILLNLGEKKEGENILVKIKHEFIKGIPLVFLFNDTIEQSAKNGTVFFFHGLLSNKMGSQKEVVSLAENGFLAVSIDNYAHGERRANDFDVRFHSNNPNFNDNFIDAIERTADDATTVADELFKQGIIFEDKLGITGISMGAFITYKVISQDKRFKVACPISGSAIWEGKDSSPHYKADNFFPTALLIQHGEVDTSVPSCDDRELYRYLKPFYAENLERLAYVEFANQGHFMSDRDWNYLWQNVIIWFKEYLTK